MAPPSPKTKLIILGLVTITLAITLIRLYSTPTPTLDNLTIKIANTNYQLQIANTVATRSQGLSNRRLLCPSCGMLFVFPRSGFYPFWMKDTLIPLDIIWLSATGKIINISHSTPVEKDPAHPQNTYQPQLPARFVLELPAGSALSLGLKEDEQLNLPSLP